MRPTIVNVYLIRAGDRWTLVDTGMNTEDSVAAFRGALAEIGIAPAAITRLVGTHHHVDHFGTSGPYRELTHAEVFLHPLEGRARDHDGAHLRENTEYLSRHGVPDVPPDKRLPPPSRFFGSWYAPASRTTSSPTRTRSRSATAARCEVVWTPGTRGPLLPPPRSPTACCSSATISCPKITPHVGLWPNGPENPLGDFLASHEKIQRVDARLVCPAHGPVYEDHRRRARQLIDFHRVRKLAMLERIRRRPLTAYEVALDVFAIAPDNRFQVFAATLETLAHLELLRREGRALRDERNGVVRYQAR
jgi:glyoxylase-like metal-dependent hydrolase (beta-lactamase superfamily II)